MSNLDIRKVKDLFSRLFVLAVQNKMNLTAFTKFLERSELVCKMEKGQYDDYFNRSLEQIFFDITNRKIDRDESFGVYNDAYWCGYSYFELRMRTGRPFVFLFLKLPLTKMMELYSIYHEMDISSLLEYLNQQDQEKTILRLLCEERNCSIPRLSSLIGISKATLSKYNASDAALYKGSFQAIYRIALFFDVPVSLFYWENLHGNSIKN